MSPMCRLYQQVLRGFQLPSDTHPGARLQPGPWMVRMSRAKIYVWLRFCVWGCLAFGFGLGASVLGFKWRIWIWDLGSQLFLKRTEGCRKFPDKPAPQLSQSLIANMVFAMMEHGVLHRAASSTPNFKP